MSEPAYFLEKLRPGGPWVLTAIIPDGGTITITARTAAEIDDFVRTYDGKRNCYYSVNPAREVMIKKAAKTDIAAIEYLLADLDPDEGEDAADAKARYLEQLKIFEPKPTAIVDSGNGIQCLWKLKDPIKLGANVLAFSPEDQAKIDDVEARTAAIMVRLGAKPGTQNIDRILRLPGTTNLPNKKKRNAGRVPCPTKSINFNDARYSLDVFPLSDAAENSKRPEPTRAAVDVDTLPVSDRIKDLIRLGDRESRYPSRSEAVMAVLVAMVGDGCTDDQMAGIMLDRKLPIGERIREHAKMVNYLKRQIEKARTVATPGQRVEVKIKVKVEDVLKSAADLQHKIFEALRWIVPKYVPEGSALMAGRPKIGKSWLGLDAGVAVSFGDTCLGQQCEQGDVLALMLEDSDRRIQRRLTRMLGAQKEKWPESLTYATGWPRLNESGLDWMRRWIDKARKPRLIIIDILERIRQRTKRDDKQSQYSADYEALVTLQELAAEAQLSILTLVHQRKLGADDLIDTVSGTLGLGGAVDSIIILGNDPQSGKFLYGRGRDLEEFSVSIKQDEQCRWQVLGPKPEEQVSPERGQIIAILARVGRPMSTKEISEAVGGKHVNVKNLLFKLCAAGEIERHGWGFYKLPDPQKELKLDDGDIPF